MSRTGHGTEREALADLRATGLFDLRKRAADQFDLEQFALVAEHLLASSRDHTTLRSKCRARFVASDVFVDSDHCDS